MKNLTTSIVSLYTATVGGDHNSFYNITSGQLYKGRAKQTAVRPYAVYNVISDVPDSNFYSTFETVRIQFDLYSDQESSSQVEDMYTYLKGLYDWCSLPLSGDTHVYMKRLSANLVRDFDDDGWHYICDYEALTEYIAAASASHSPSASPSVSPSSSPSRSPSVSPSRSPSVSPSVSPSASPSVAP